MEYISRELERKFMAMNQAFKAVMVTWARQVGKSTMLKNWLKEKNEPMLIWTTPETGNWQK